MADDFCKFFIQWWKNILSSIRFSMYLWNSRCMVKFECIDNQVISKIDAHFGRFKRPKCALAFSVYWYSICYKIACTRTSVPLRHLSTEDMNCFPVFGTLSRHFRSLFRESAPICREFEALSPGTKSDNRFCGYSACIPRPSYPGKVHPFVANSRHFPSPPLENFDSRDWGTEWSDNETCLETWKHVTVPVQINLHCSRLLRIFAPFFFRTTNCFFAESAKSA